MKLRLPSRGKVWEWAKRYGVQEAVASCAALCVALFLQPYLLASHISWIKAKAVSSVVATDIAVFYLYGLVRAYLSHKKSTTSRVARVGRSVRDVVLEFVAPGVVNMMLIRPFLVGTLPVIFGNVVIGVAVAQVLAAISFYAMVIPLFERRELVRRKLGEWIRRYSPQEITALAAALLAAHVLVPLLTPITHAWLGRIFISYGITIADAWTYYIVTLFRELMLQRRKGLRGRTAFAITMRNLALEFGIADVVDTLFSRPFCMYWGTFFGGPVFGVMLGWFCATIAFYAIVIPSYELRKRLFRERERTPE